jgi:drug/metabolite transporter (DMT)-like permease
MKKAYVYIALATVIISTMEIAGRVLGRDLNATQVNFWRFLIGSVILLPIAVRDMRRRHLRLDSGDGLFILAAAFVGIALSMELYQTALETTRAATVAVIVSCVPVAVIPLACLFLKERLTVNTVLSLIFCVAGIICILNPLELDPEFRGIAAAVGVVVTFAAYSVMGKAKADAWGSVSFTFMGFVAGTAMLLGIIGLSYLTPAPPPGSLLAPFHDIPLMAGITARNLPVLVYFGAVGTGLLYALFFLAMEETSAAMGSVVFFFKPALAPVFAWMALGEQISTRVMVGIGLILAGTWFVFRPGGAH